jgi:hypothetical protein
MKFSANDALSLLSTPIFGLVCASYIANYFGVSILEPLYGRRNQHDEFDNDEGEDNGSIYADGSEYYLKPKRRYLHAPDNFITSRHLMFTNETLDKKVEKWELTLIGWDFELAHVLNERMNNGSGALLSGGSASSLHRSGSSQSLTPSGSGADLGDIDPNTSMPYMPERFLLAEAGDYSKALER